MARDLSVYHLSFATPSITSFPAKLPSCTAIVVTAKIPLVKALTHSGLLKISRQKFMIYN